MLCSGVVVHRICGLIMFKGLGSVVWNTTGGCHSRHTLPSVSCAGFTGGQLSTQVKSIRCLSCPAGSLTLDLGPGHGQCLTRLEQAGTMHSGRNEPGTQVWTALSRHRCGLHRAGIGVDNTRQKIGVDYTRQGHPDRCPKNVVTRGEWPS